MAVVRDIIAGQRMHRTCGLTDGPLYQILPLHRYLFHPMALGEQRMERITEREALDRARKDPHAFAPLYEHHFADVYRFIHRRTNHNDLSADLAQQTFLKALLALQRYEDRGLPFRAWLYRIAMNELRMYWRKRKEVVLDVDPGNIRELANDVDAEDIEELPQRILQLLGTLDEARQRLIELRYFDGLAFAEVGQVLGIGEDAAKMRTHRVLKLLRERLEGKQ